MKLRNLFVLAVTIAAASLCAQGQESDGFMTFTDHLGQSISVSRFGTVLSFKDRKGRLKPSDNTLLICPSGDNRQCIDSSKADGTSASLKAKFPEPGEALAKRQMLDVTATINRGPLTVIRRVTWQSGSRIVNLKETISARSAIVLATLEESAPGIRDTPCPPPPVGEGKCPGKLRALKIKSGKIKLTRKLTISPGNPVRIFFTNKLTR